MTILIWVLSVVVLLVVLALVVALFVKQQYSVEPFVDVDRPRQQVFDYVKFLKNQEQYSKWASMDPGMKKEFRGADGEVGCVSAWDSDHKNVGKGEQEIVAIREGERIDYELRFLRPFKSTHPAFMTTQSLDENRTRVSWGFSGRMNYPMNLMLLFMNMENMILNDLETGLHNLKNILENSAHMGDAG